MNWNLEELFPRIGIGISLAALGLVNAIAQVELEPPSQVYFWPGNLNPAGWMADGETILMTSSHGVHAWNPASQIIENTFPLPTRSMRDAYATQDGTRLFGLSWEGKLRQWDASDGTVLKEIDVLAQPIDR